MCVYKKTSGGPTNFLVMYMGDIKYIRKIVLKLHSVNDVLITNIFIEKTWVKHLVYLASIVIDESRC